MMRWGISILTELVLIDQYIHLERQETTQFGQLVHTLDHIPIYTAHLREVRIISPPNQLVGSATSKGREMLRKAAPRRDRDRQLD